MGDNRVLHISNTPLLWSRGTALFGLSGPGILKFGELSTIPREIQARHEPRSVGHAQRSGDRRRDSQA